MQRRCNPLYIARVQKIRCDSGTLVFCVRSLFINPRLHGKQRVRRSRKSATAQNVEGCPPAERKPRSLFEILSAEDTELIFEEPAWGKAAWVAEEGSTVSAFVSAEQSQHFLPEVSSQQPIEQCLTERDNASPVSAPPTPLCCTRCGDIIRATTSSPPSTEATIVPRRRFQKGRVYQRGRTQKWVGSFRDDKIDPLTGQLKRIRRTVTFDSSVTSRRAALRALQPYLDGVNIDPPPPKRGGKTVAELVAEWKTEILPNRKPGGARACLSHLRKHIVPLLGKMTLREVNPKTIQTFVTTVGMRVDRKKTVENV